MSYRIPFIDGIERSASTVGSGDPTAPREMYVFRSPRIAGLKNGGRALGGILFMTLRSGYIVGAEQCSALKEPKGPYKKGNIPKASILSDPCGVAGQNAVLSLL